MEFLIIAAFAVAVILIAALSAYIFYLKNELFYRYNQCGVLQDQVDYWQNRCNKLADGWDKSFDTHEEKYMDICKKIDELVEENLKKDDQLEDLKSKYDALNESLNDKLMENTINRIKVTSLDDIFDEDTEELDFPNSHNEEDE